MRHSTRLTRPARAAYAAYPPFGADDDGGIALRAMKPIGRGSLEISILDLQNGRVGHASPTFDAGQPNRLYAFRMYSSTFFASTSSGTLPPSTTVSLKAFRSNFGPSAFCAFSR